MNLINEAEIRDTWSPIIESATGISESSKLGWMSQYCHNHKLYEEANIMSLNPMNLHGMGAASVGTANTPSSLGSGDKAPSLLPLAMQVAAQTIGLDLVPVVPMAGPMGLLSYLDFSYAGGNLTTKTTPDYVKVLPTPSASNAASITAWKALNTNTGTNTVSAGNYGAYKFIGESRIDGKWIFQVVSKDTATATIVIDITAAITANATTTGITGTVELVKAMEDHIKGFAGDQTTTNTNDYSTPYSREDGESTPDRIMGLTLFSKTIAAETFQVAAAVTREQVQDLKQFGVDAVAQVETVLTNELTQSINSLILGKIAELGLANVKVHDGGLGTLLDVAMVGASLVGGQNESSEHRRILTGILAAANFIANTGRRGAGNFAVVNAKIASAIQSVAGFQPAPMANTVNQNAGGIYPIGSVAGVNCYTDPNMLWSDTTVLVGRKGDGNSAGLVFMPYLMAESVQTIAEGTMAPKVAVKSRFALVEAGHNTAGQYVSFECTGFVL